MPAGLATAIAAGIVLALTWLFGPLQRPAAAAGPSCSKLTEELDSEQSSLRTSQDEPKILQTLRWQTNTNDEATAAKNLALFTGKVRVYRAYPPRNEHQRFFVAQLDAALEYWRAKLANIRSGIALDPAEANYLPNLHAQSLAKQHEIDAQERSVGFLRRQAAECTHTDLALVEG